ncbi:hypothetical protein HRI_001364100 [Hibiscus trionum]|uniref:Uncharacterized protein n=1 Tax=Hibiscus trionum TaxID=183268 RepID=A0A9W7HGG5_HIBTR|nr:hypothetical protein HRI_001364100 [Hibiscus trionum]
MLMRKHSESLAALAATLKLELETVMDQKEISWHQKACSQWISQGDRSTKFFYTLVIARRRANRISALQRDDGGWFSNANELMQLATTFYRDMFTSST